MVPLLPMVSLVKFPMVPLGESRTHALLGLPMVPLGLPMVPLVPTFPPMVTLAPMVPLAAEKRSGFSGYQWCHWLPIITLVKFPMVPLGESRTHAYIIYGMYRAGVFPHIHAYSRQFQTKVTTIASSNPIVKDRLQNKA